MRPASFLRLSTIAVLVLFLFSRPTGFIAGATAKLQLWLLKHSHLEGILLFESPAVADVVGAGPSVSDNTFKSVATEISLQLLQKLLQFSDNLDSFLSITAGRPHR